MNFIVLERALMCAFDTPPISFPSQYNISILFFIALLLLLLFASDNLPFYGELSHGKQHDDMWQII